MDITSFTFEELNIIESFLQVSTNVSNIIDYLCSLEINGQKDSEEYYITMQKLINAIDIENKKYQSSNISYQQCYKFIKLLSQKASKPMFYTKPTTNIKQYQHRVINRIISILTMIVRNNKEYHKNSIPEELIESIINLGILTSKDEFLKTLENNTKIQSTLEADINSMFLSILEESILKRENQKYREELIKAKYCLATSNKELEVLLLESKFNIPSIIYINSQIINELLRESDFSYEAIKFTELKMKAATEISKLLKIKDSEYMNINIYIESIISSCYLRALLSLMTGEEINEFNQEFHDYIDKPEYMRKHLNDRISENIILNCFKCFNRDKAKTRILSTKQ